MAAAEPAPESAPRHRSPRPRWVRVTAWIVLAVTLVALRWDAVRVVRHPRNAAPLAAIFGFPHRWAGSTNWVRSFSGVVIKPPNSPTRVVSTRLLPGAGRAEPPPHAVAWVRMVDSHNYSGFLWRREFVVLEHETRIEPIGDNEIDAEHLPLWLSMADRERVRQWVDYHEEALKAVPWSGMIDRWSFRALQHGSVRTTGASFHVFREQRFLKPLRAAHSLLGVAGIALAGAMVYLLCTPSRRYADPDTCEACGYDLAGLTDRPCPECGARR